MGETDERQQLVITFTSPGAATFELSPFGATITPPQLFAVAGMLKCIAEQEVAANFVLMVAQRQAEEEQLAKIAKARNLRVN